MNDALAIALWDFECAVGLCDHCQDRGLCGRHELVLARIFAAFDSAPGEDPTVH